ncbi:MAG: universal stress protein [SAR202 cluster bacterium]|nr:universal stress protein [SAR202 cluster bacterium]
MYKSVLIPLDGTKEGEAVLTKVLGELAPGAEVTLLRIIERAQTKRVDGVIRDARMVEGEARDRAHAYLVDLAGRLPKGLNYNAEVSVAESVAHGIVNFANHKHVELIAMYTHRRKPVVNVFQNSVSKAVKHGTKTPVKVYTQDSLKTKAS